MKVAIASDHRGYRAKEQIKIFLQTAGHSVVDFGCESPASCDYPDHALSGAKAVAAGNSERGIFLCGTGIGMSIMANKVRAAFGRRFVTMNSRPKCRAPQQRQRALPAG